MIINYMSHDWQEIFMDEIDEFNEAENILKEKKKESKKVIFQYKDKKLETNKKKKIRVIYNSRYCHYMGEDENLE